MLCECRARGQGVDGQRKSLRVDLASRTLLGCSACPTVIVYAVDVLLHLFAVDLGSPDTES